MGHTLGHPKHTPLATDRSQEQGVTYDNVRSGRLLGVRPLGRAHAGARQSAAHDSGVLQYVGKAMNSFDDRIWDRKHDEYRRWTDLIPFCGQFCSLARALEFFLIARSAPPRNDVYRGYRIEAPKREA